MLIYMTGSEDEEEGKLYQEDLKKIMEIMDKHGMKSSIQKTRWEEIEINEDIYELLVDIMKQKRFSSLNDTLEFLMENYENENKKTNG